jgi:ABC-2 type transport system ATP-binding protein
MRLLLSDVNNKSSAIRGPSSPNSHVPSGVTPIRTLSVVICFRVIEVDHLRKTYGDFKAVNDITFSAQPGEIFGLLGPNGAGKTTTISCISGLLTPTDGHIRVMGHDVVREGTAARRALGVVPQEISLYDDLSAVENLNYWGGTQGMRNPLLRERVNEVLALTGLADRAREPVKQFSGGMRRRLNFACGIVHRPKVLLLDEPTVGVDPQSRVRLLELVRAQAQAGTCVLYTTHYMEEAETMCDRLAIVDHGNIIAAGTLAELRALLAQHDLLRLSGLFPPDAATKALQGIDHAEVLQADENLLVLSLPEASRRLPAIFSALAAAGAEVRGTTLTQPSLESLFIKLTGKELRE